MKYVLDSNISLKSVLTEADSDKALRLRSGFQNQLHELLAPDVFPVEVAHGLAKAERRRVIPQGDAERALNLSGAIVPAAASSLYSGSLRSSNFIGRYFARKQSTARADWAVARDVL